MFLSVRIVRFYWETLTLLSMVIAETVGRYSIDGSKFKFKYTLPPAFEATPHNARALHVSRPNLPLVLRNFYFTPKSLFHLMAGDRVKAISRESQSPSDEAFVFCNVSPASFFYF